MPSQAFILRWRQWEEPLQERAGGRPRKALTDRAPFPGPAAAAGPVCDRAAGRGRRSLWRCRSAGTRTSLSLRPGRSGSGEAEPRGCADRPGPPLPGEGVGVRGASLGGPLGQVWA